MFMRLPTHVYEAFLDPSVLHCPPAPLPPSDPFCGHPCGTWAAPVQAVGPAAARTGAWGGGRRKSQSINSTETHKIK